ncbi:MAG: hypothetical protein EDM69_07825 [Chlorobiota bacterium]|nr:MAG: hypothetical protein EDM69_07825 [Chlorobiota bacterium]MCE7953229.1 hypothetical protein [Chlorobi bacterium CHB7]RIK50136.1 MAG: hypothetical protein DCC60_01640 [Ignavibacteriota bacterium]
MIPLIAMQFTNEVDWSIGDFLIMGILLFGTGTLCEIVFRKTRRITYRVLFTFGLLLIFFLIWAELAVGIFGTPFAGT